MGRRARDRRDQVLWVIGRGARVREAWAEPGGGGKREVVVVVVVMVWCERSRRMEEQE